MSLSPIVLFTYNRLWHTQQTVEALQENELANESELFIYSDGGRDEESWKKVNEVRKYLQTIQGFKDVKIIEQERNLGLADSIISGVTKIVNQYGKIIVLEDDIVTNPYFLRFMNDALDFYEYEDKVWHISGWNYPVKINTTKEVYFSSFGNTWGWATWFDRWSYFKKNTDYLLEKFDSQMIYKFNIDDSFNFWKQVVLNKKNEINTWAIYWYATFFLHDGLCLNPIKSLVQNIGFDGSGQNCGTSNLYATDEVKLLKVEDFTTDGTVNDFMVDKIKLYYHEKLKSNNSFIEKLRTIYNQLDSIKSTNEKFFVFGSGTGAKLIINYIPESILKIIVGKRNSSSSILGKEIVFIEELEREINNKIIISSFGYEKEIEQLLIKNHIDLNRLIFLQY